MLDLGRDASGKRQRVWRSEPDKPSALAALRAMQAAADAGTDVRGARRSVQAATDDFLEHGLDPTRAAGTRYKTGHYCRRFADALGHRRLLELSVRDVEDWLALVAKEGKDGKARATLVEARGAASQMLDHAARMGWLPPERNAARLARLPQTKLKRERTILQEDDLTRLLEAAADDWYHALLLFVACAGVRIGEASALAWTALDTETGVVAITRATRVEPNGALSITAPKRGNKRRIQLGPALLQVLQAHRRRVIEHMLANGRPVPDLMFPTRVGSMPDPSNMRRLLRRVQREANVSLLGYHDLRHTMASDLADRGTVPVKVGAQLGHSARTAQNIYTHPFAEIADAGLDRAESLVGKLHYLSKG